MIRDTARAIKKGKDQEGSKPTNSGDLEFDTIYMYHLIKVVMTKDKTTSREIAPLTRPGDGAP